MTNKVVSIKSVIEYAFSSFRTGITRIMLLMGTACALSTYLGDILGKAMSTAGAKYMVLKEAHGAFFGAWLLPFAALWGSVFFGFLIASCLLGLMQMRFSLLVYDKKSMDVKAFSGLFSWLFRFVIASLLFFALWLVPAGLVGLIALVSWSIVIGKFVTALLALPVLLWIFFSMIKLGYFPYFIIENRGVIDSFRKSWQITTGHFWTIVGMLTFFTVVRGVGTFVLGVFYKALPDALYAQIAYQVINFLVIVFLFGIPQLLGQVYMYRKLSEK